MQRAHKTGMLHPSVFSRLDYACAQKNSELWIRTRVLLNELQKELDLNAPNMWTPSIPLEWPLLDRVVRWLEIEASYRAEVDECILFPRQKWRWSWLSKPATYYLQHRVRYALETISPLVIYQDSKPMSIFPFPPIQPKEMIQWLLTIWWEGRGKHAATRKVVEESDQHQMKCN